MKLKQFLNALTYSKTSEELAIQKQLLEKLYSKAKLVKDKRTGIEFKAVHHKDIDHEYWKLTGNSLR